MISRPHTAAAPQQAMKPNQPRTSLFGLALLAALALSGCAQYATVTVTRPHLLEDAPAAGADRLAQQLIHRALNQERSQPLTALASLVEAAEGSARQLGRNPSDADARRDYNFAVGRIFGLLRDAHLAPWAKPLKLGSRTLAWQPHPKKLWNPALYELIPADQLEIRGTYVSDRETKEGLGAPLVAKRVGDQVHDYAPTPHFYYCATGLARFEGSRCVLSMEDPLEVERTRLGRRSFPLAADFTAPLGMMLVEMKPKQLELPRLLHPSKFAATTRIARLEPYDPDKTVVLFVHGLMDSPATWTPLINHLRADEDVRRNYQFWFYSYPSGYPYPYSAEILRCELDQAERHYPLRKKLVVIGHSMGGCISRLLITESGERIWNQMYTVPPEKMDVSEAHRHILTESTIFKHRPEIGRVIFISAPHQGSVLASDWFGRFASRLVQAPTALFGTGLDILRYEKRSPGELHLKRYPDSVDTLAPNNNFVLALHKVPIVRGIPYHTIAGDRGRGDSPKSSDGVVPYWSSHLEGAESEKIVASHHGAHRNQDAIAEVRRILALHAATNP